MTNKYEKKVAASVTLKMQFFLFYLWGGHRQTGGKHTHWSYLSVTDDKSPPAGCGLQKLYWTQNNQLHKITCPVYRYRVSYTKRKKRVTTHKLYSPPPHTQKKIWDTFIEMLKQYCVCRAKTVVSIFPLYFSAPYVLFHFHLSTGNTTVFANRPVTHPARLCFHLHPL